MGEPHCFELVLRPSDLLQNMESRGQDEKSIIKRRIASMVCGGEDEDREVAFSRHVISEQNVLLYPTGMSAIW